MLLALLATATLAGPPAPAPAAVDTDTTFAVRRGQSLQVETHGGTIVVRAWNRDAVRITAKHSSRAEVEIDVDEEGLIDVEASMGRYGTPTAADFEISVPAWMPVSAEGVYTEITVTGVEASISAETVQGNIEVRGGRELVQLETVEGSVSLTGAQGTIEVSSVNNGLTLVDVRGQVMAETVNGPITVRRSTLEVLEGTTVNGDIVYEGPLQKNGRYSLGTHNGRLVLATPGQPDATITVSTFGGEIESDFPVQLPAGERRRGKRHTFTLGGGGARVELETFNGSIVLRRAGAGATE
jgi:hypothetical protein